MTRVYAPPQAFRPLIFGATGGLLAAVVALALLVAIAVENGLSASVAPNALGAWFVRWLQTARPSALAGFYPDATLGGAAAFILIGALVGAIFAAFLARLPEDHPLAWGAMLGFGLWLLMHWVVAPALDPVLTRALPPGLLMVADLAYGLILGGWVHAGRRVSGPVY